MTRSSAGSSTFAKAAFRAHVQDHTSLTLQPMSSSQASAFYSLDMALIETPAGVQEAMMALPLLPEDTFGPRALGVRATDIVRHSIGAPPESLSKPLICAEEEVEKRQFWAIRLRALAQNAHTLLTL